MCELLGINFDRPVSANISISAFGKRWTENADGWGLAWYPDRSLAVVKEPLAWGQTPYSQFLESYNRLRATLYLAHVRHGTTGGAPTHSDTHPFSREWLGREFCFAHNGTIDNFAKVLPLGRFHPIGGTDSEHLFCWLLDSLVREENSLETPTEWAGLERLLRLANAHGRLNCLLADGRRLFAYRDLREWKGLWSLVGSHEPTAEQPPLSDDSLRVEIEPEAATSSVVIATCPLNEETWRPIPPGGLLAVEEGRVVYASEVESRQTFVRA